MGGPLPALNCGHLETDLATRGPNKGSCKICLHRRRVNAYYYANKEKVKAYWRQYREAGKDWRLRNVEKALLMGARMRARRKGIPFSISVDDIIIPEKCPVLGIKLVSSSGPRSGASPTLDRVDNSLGYVKGNVVVMSWKANRIKSDASIEELQAIVNWWRAR